MLQLKTADFFYQTALKMCTHMYTCMQMLTHICYIKLIHIHTNTYKIGLQKTIVEFYWTPWAADILTFVSLKCLSLLQEETG